MKTKNLLVFLAINNIIISTLINSNSIFYYAFLVCSILFLIAFNIKPCLMKYSSNKLNILYSGTVLLKTFLISLLLTIILNIVVLIVSDDINYKSYIFSFIFNFLFLSLIFWNGITRVYIISLQLGLKHRILGIVCGWIPFLNIYYLTKIIKICDEEVRFVNSKNVLNESRKEEQICMTKYPLLLVHGVFFRDIKHLNYWGRIPKELEINGATIYYGNQHSAGTVEMCGEEIAQRIKEIVSSTNCEKVNIIAHSKGGLDCRYAISMCGCEDMVASLTTINTPHNGCIFSEYLINNMPRAMKSTLAKTYNSTLKKLGESDPDFVGAVESLSNTNCMIRNKEVLDNPNVLYESVMSYSKKATSGKFPLNISYNIVKNFDGINDGLVSVESAKWGSRFTLIEPLSNRGITHADMIDLNRENIEGFDVREFYVSLVAFLKNRGY